MINGWRARDRERRDTKLGRRKGRGWIGHDKHREMEDPN